MSEQRPPARPWYDLVTEQAAIRGWSIHELSRRSGVGRPTIYRWRDGTEVPQSRPVGLVADALGIDRARAVRLAGIIESEPEPEPEAAAIPPGIVRLIRRHYSPAQQREIIEALTAIGQPPGEEQSARHERDAS